MKPRSIASTPTAHRTQAEVHAIPTPPAQAWAQAGAKPVGVSGLDLTSRTGQLRGTFNVLNEKAMREELEIAFVSMNGSTFRGSVTLQEAKHIIYKECLGFEDLSNFDGARTGYKGGPIVTLKLKKAINVDKLIPFQHFNFQRKSSRQGKSHIDTISCFIRGLRKPDNDDNQNLLKTTKQETDEGVRVIKIEGCDYKIPEEVILEFLSHYGEVQSEVMEDLFDDGGILDSETHGTNRSGIYSVKIKLVKDIPQLLPILGRRVKIQYRGTQRMCTNCFGRHPKQTCRSQKVQWSDHVTRFMSSNMDIREEIIKRPIRKPVARDTDINVDTRDTSVATEDWVNGNTIQPNKVVETTEKMEVANMGEVTNCDIIEVVEVTEVYSQSDEPSLGPTKADFLVPANKTEHEDMVSTLMKAGIRYTEAEQLIALRKTSFNRACKDFKKTPSNANKQTQKKTNRKSKQLNKSQDEHVN